MLDAIQISAIESAMADEHRKDREALQRLKRFLPSNGSNGHKAIVIVPATPVASQLQSEEEEDEEEQTDPDTLIGKVQEIMSADATKKWTVPTMIKHLRGVGFTFATKTPNSTIGLVFSKLYKRGKIRRVRKGSGRTPNTFRAIVAQEHKQEELLLSERATS